MFDRRFYEFLGRSLALGGSTDVMAWWEVSPTRYPRSSPRRETLSINPDFRPTEEEVWAKVDDVPFGSLEVQDAVYAALSACGLVFNDANTYEKALAKRARNESAPLAAELLDAFGTQDEQSVVACAIGFAAVKHAGQERLDGELHLAHVLRVGLHLARSMEKDAERLTGVFAGILHDTIEDTDAGDGELMALFGTEVAGIVRALSHIEEEEPDEVYLARVAQGGRLAIMVKRADKLDNINSLAKAPPDFRATKIAETRAAFPIWQRIDPVAVLIFEAALQTLMPTSAGICKCGSGLLFSQCSGRPNGDRSYCG